jgi:hypothetical protein
VIRSARRQASALCGSKASRLSSRPGLSFYEQLRVEIARAFLQTVGGPALHHLSVHHDRHVVADRPRDREVVADEELLQRRSRRGQ